MIKISYLVALYNKEKYILDAVKSILDDAASDYELQICVVDDGSTDRSLAVLKERYAADVRVVIDGFENNRGKVAAYNRAFELSDGNYIAILGADDMVVNGRTKKMLVASIAAHRPVYGGLIKYVEETGGKTIMLPYPAITLNQNILQNWYSGGAVLMRRIDCDDIFPMPEKLKFEDWWISFHLLRKGAVETLNEPVTIYRIHSANDFGTAEVSFDSIKRDYARHFDYLNAFKPYIEDKLTLLHLRRAVGLRGFFFSKRDFLGLFAPPYDKSWLKLLIFNIFGAKLSTQLMGWFRNLRAK